MKEYLANIFDKSIDELKNLSVKALEDEKDFKK